MQRNELLLLQMCACLFMTGLIWTVQLVHYPAFRYVAEARFEPFHTFHSNRISWIVAPMMGLELLTAIFLFSLSPSSWLERWNIVSVGLTWVLTFALSVPLHSKLSDGYAPASIESLIFTNWARTLLWTARSAVFLPVVRSLLR